MIKAQYIEKQEFNVRSSGDKRKKVDTYFVLFHCPTDSINARPHDWVCKFEVPVGKKFKMQDFDSKACAHAVKGYTI